MSILRAGLFLVATLATAATAAPATVVATPTTVGDVLNRAAPGQTIRLAAGSYEPIALRGHSWSPPVTVDATAATLRGIRVDNVSGLTWRGGIFDGGDAERSAFNVGHSDHLVIDGVTFRHFVRNGIGLGSVADVRVTNNVFSDMGSDGLDIAMSRRIVVDHNRCHDFQPTQGAHADCIQLWSHATEAPTADVTLTNNEAIGNMQGFTLFNHVRNGVDDGGFDRITVEHNFARVSTYWGVGVNSCRNCIVRHNRVETLPSDNPRIRAWIKVNDGNVNCDNRAAAFPNWPGTDKCRERDERPVDGSSAS